MPDLAGTKTGYISFCGPIDANGVTRIAQSLNGAVNEKYDCVYLTFSSNGGFVAEGVYLYNHIMSLPVKAIMHNIGTVASSAATVFVAGAERYCSPNSLFMIHPVAMLPSGAMMAGSLQSTLEAAINDETRIDAILRERTTLPEDILTSRRSGDIYITAQKALEFGLVHEVREFSLPPGNQIFQI